MVHTRGKTGASNNNTRPWTVVVVANLDITGRFLLSSIFFVFFSLFTVIQSHSSISR